MSVSLKYAVIERERRYRLLSLPGGIAISQEIVRYITGTQMRLREVDGAEPTDVAPAWLDVAEDISADKRWTGAGVAHRAAGRVDGPSCRPSILT